MTFSTDSKRYQFLSQALLAQLVKVLWVALVKGVLQEVLVHMGTVACLGHKVHQATVNTAIMEVLQPWQPSTISKWPHVEITSRGHKMT